MLVASVLSQQLKANSNTQRCCHFAFEAKGSYYQGQTLHSVLVYQPVIFGHNLIEAPWADSKDRHFLFLNRQPFIN